MRFQWPCLRFLQWSRARFDWGLDGFLCGESVACPADCHRAGTGLGGPCDFGPCDPSIPGALGFADGLAAAGLSGPSLWQRITNSLSTWYYSKWPKQNATQNFCSDINGLDGKPMHEQAKLPGLIPTTQMANWINGSISKVGTLTNARIREA